MLEDRRRLARRLEEEAGRLSRESPGVRVRFAEVVGRRLSHLAGSPASLTAEETRLEITPRIVALLSGDLDGFDSRGWAEGLRRRMKGTGAF
jgi:hypothetical protein